MTIKASYPTIEPTLSLDFANSKRLDPRVTFTRNSVGTYFDAAGVLRTAAVNEPRFDHDPATGESLGLLIEESRTNLLLRSEELGDTTWTTNAVAASVLVNQITSPAGTTTADLLRADNGTTLSPVSGSSLIRQDISKSASAITYTLSCYAKAFGHDGFRMLVRDSASGSNIAYAFYGLTGAGAVNDTFVGGTFSGLFTSIQVLSNGWYRCQLTFTTGTETGLRILLFDSSSTSITANGTDGVYLWGAQLEAGAFPTSYIKTEGTTITRQADTAVMTGSNLDSWFNIESGTFFAAFSAQNSVNRYALSASFGSASHLLYIRNTPQGSDSAMNSDSVNVAFRTRDYSRTPATLAKHAFVYDTDYFECAAQGLLSGSGPDTSCAVPLAISRFDVGSLYGTVQIGGHIRSIRYWNTRLPDATLQALTAS